MNNTHIQELHNIDMWLKIGAIDYDKAKAMAQFHIDAINVMSKTIAKKHGVKPRYVSFHNFIH